MAFVRKRRPPRVTVETAPPVPLSPGVEIAQHDPLHAYLIQAGGPVELGRLDLESDAVTAPDCRANQILLPNDL